MARYNVAIIEDSGDEIRRLETYFSRYEAAAADSSFKLNVFGTAESFLAQYNGSYDFVLMDIMLPGMNGMDAAAALRRIDESVTLVFVTNMAQFAVKGYEVQAFDFLVKPIAYRNFVIKLQRILGKLKNTQKGEQIILNLADRKVCIPISLICYVELVGHNLVYHTEQGDFSLFGSMKIAAEKLNPSVFFRCNSCYLVNLNYVESIEGNETVVAGHRLQISRARKKAFVQQMNQFLGGNF